MKALAAVVMCWGALAATAGADALKPIIDNERVRVWDVTWEKGKPDPLGPHAARFVTIYLAGAAVHKKGDAMLEPPGTTHGEDGTRSIVIELKDHAVAPIANQSGYPNAFPRPGVKKILENDHILIWNYTWLPGRPTPMHFHDKDVVVVYLENGALKSTTPDGKSVVNEYAYGMTKFNRRDRMHSEELVKGTQHAVMVELK